MVFGSLGGFTGGWMAFIQAVTIAPIEVEATLGYLNSKFTGLDIINANGTLNGKGILIGAGFMLVFTVINLVGVRWLAETNSIAMIWKLLVPTITIFALLFTVFHFPTSAGGGFLRRVPRHLRRPALGGGVRHRRIRAGHPGGRRGGEPAAEHPRP